MWKKSAETMWKKSAETMWTRLLTTRGREVVSAMKPLAMTKARVAAAGSRSAFTCS